MKRKGRKPKVSVVVPVYNSERTIEKCLLSILDQTYPDYEVVVAYTRSPDRTLKIIKKVMKKDDRVRMVKCKVRGRGAARNTCIEGARTDILVWTDADCEVPRDWVERMVAPILVDDEDVVQGNESSAGGGLWPTLSQRAGQRHLDVHMKKKGYIDHLDTKNFAVKSSVLDDVGGFNGVMRSNEDFEFKVRLTKNMYKIRYLSKVKVVHHHRKTLKALLYQKYEQGYWTSVTYNLHKNFFDNEDKEETVVQPLYLSYYVTAPFKLVRFIFTYGFMDGLFVTLTCMCIAAGTLTAKPKMNEILARMKKEGY